jgi:multimeric flavodoxin WrbA
MSTTLLVVHHTPSPATRELLEAVLAGANDPEIDGVDVSGALKLAFDQSYYQLLDATSGRPFGVFMHGNEGAEGAKRALDGITAGLGWVRSAETVVVSGKPTKADVEACWNLGATVAATLMEES